MSETVHLAKLLNHLRAANREVGALVDTSATAVTTRQAAKWSVAIRELEQEVNMRAQALDY